MTDLTKLNFQPEYVTGSFHNPQHMMRLALQNSILYRRASGYFSSSVFNLFKEETLNFAKFGGKIHLMCSPVMSPDDLEQISLGYEAKSLITKNLMENVSDLADDLSKRQELSFLATLIHTSVLDIKLIFFEAGKGIFHDKSGYFKDCKGNLLSFMGSANESSNAFSGEGNFERISVFSSWRDTDARRCKSTETYVDNLWEGNIRGLGVFDFPDVAKEFLVQFSKQNLNGLDQVIGTAKKKRKELMLHQSLALENWRSSGKRGILKHATGSGKTITAVGAIKEHINQGMPVLVLVPSKLLLEQWYEAINQEIEEVLILRCGGGHVNWKKTQNLRQMFYTVTDGDLGGIVIAINDTASSSNFLNSLVNLKNTLLVVDEAHALGSSKNSHLMLKDFGFRLGLSATPERYRDEEGTEKLFNFFNGVIQPEVTLLDALKSGRLVPYDYYPILTELTAEEEADWVKITNKIINYIRARDINTQKIKSDKVLSSMLINRSRIAKKARSKVDAVVNTLSHFFLDGQHWLVYCEDSSQLYEINDKLISLGINPLIYVSEMSGSPKDELEAFSSQGGVLLSIRCLDEGVDIPKISHAIIAASSQNPRQFIQRRGRVLRKAEGKLSAVIYDCIVVPCDTSNESKFDGLILSEATRSIQFARTARNAAASESTLRKILINIGSDPDELILEIDGDSEND